LEEAIAKYTKWSCENTTDRKQIPIFYCSAYGNTAALAGAVRKGILRFFPDAACEVFNIIEHDMHKLANILNSSDAFAIGCPTINRDVVPPVSTLLANVDAVNIANRSVALFASFGWSGEGFATTSARLQSLKCRLFEEQFKVKLVPAYSDLVAAENFGERFAKSL
jgi:flavorubredoxin